MLFVVLMTVPLVAIAALAVDVSWWQVGATQLQGSADAAALAGVRGLQQHREPTDLVLTRDSVRSYARRTGVANTAFSQTLTVADADIEPMFYDPATNPDTVASNWGAANAVKVTVRATPSLILGGITRAVAPQVSRTSVAWIANVNSGTCIIPWGLPYTTLYDKAAQIAGSGASTAFPRPNLTNAHLEALSDPNTETARTIVLYGQNASPTPPVGNSLTAFDGGWIGYGYSGNSGQTAFQSGFWACDNTVVTVASSGGTTLATQGADVPCWTVRSLMGNGQNSCNTNNYNYLTDVGPNPAMCTFAAPTDNGLAGPSKVTTYNAGCYPASSTTAGVMLRVTWSDLTGTGSNALSYRVIGRLKLICIFRGASGTPGPGGTGVTNESCTSGTNTYTNLPMGTVVAQLQGISSDAITPTTVLGNVNGDIQRLILVK